MTKTEDQQTVSVVEGFQNLFGVSPQVVSRAPGRLEVLGNHTDYNEGFALSAAVNLSTMFAMSKRSETNTCRVHDLRDGSSCSFRLDQIHHSQLGDWSNYLKGVISAFQARGIEVPAFDATLLSQIPLSAGMSSSAALEMSLALAIERLTGQELSWLDLARIGQECENSYLGAQTGLLDQISSLRGRAGCLVLIDFRSLEVRTIPIPQATSFVVANSMVKHDLTAEYNDRRQSCAEAVAELKQCLPNITALRDVSLTQLEAHGSVLSEKTLKRARHVVNENERVVAGVALLQSGEFSTFGRSLFVSHRSSRLDFENSCVELDVLVTTAESLGAIGARLSGGGFGGITIHITREGESDRYRRKLSQAFEVSTGRTPETYLCEVSDGASVVS